MKRDQIERALDLRSEAIDLEAFAAALTVRHLRLLVSNDGSERGGPDDETAFHPQHLEHFLHRAVDAAQKTGHFEHEWRSLQRTCSQIAVAWQQGQVQFQQDLTRAVGNQEEMAYLSMIDFAKDSFAFASAIRLSPHDRALQNWTINGYMLAWRQHFLEDDATSHQPEAADHPE